MELTARQLRILGVVVERYIETGEPVGSKYVAAYFLNEVSPATIRNEMSVLDLLDILTQPHTSAGRIPTHRGLRIYIDRLMQRKPLTEEKQQYINSVFKVSNVDPLNVIEQVTVVLSEILRCATVASTPSMGDATIRRIDLLQIDYDNWAVALISSGGSIKTSVCKVALNESESIMIKVMIAQKLTGVRLRTINPTFIRKVSESLGEYAALAMPILYTIMTLSDEILEGELKVLGSENLLSISEIQDKNIGYHIPKEALAHLLETPGEKTRIILDDETSKEGLPGTSLVVTKYRYRDGSEGQLGVVAPLRADYAALISHLEYFADLLGRMLS